MAKECDICGKKPLVGNSVSHSNNKTKRRWMPNLQNVRVVEENKSVKKKKVCTKCLQAGKVKKAIRVKKAV